MIAMSSRRCSADAALDLESILRRIFVAITVVAGRGILPPDDLIQLLDEGTVTRSSTWLSNLVFMTLSPFRGEVYVQQWKSVRRLDG